MACVVVSSKVEGLARDWLSMSVGVGIGVIGEVIYVIVFKIG